MNESTGKSSHTIAVLAGVYPKTSETFVKREMDGLASAGWSVVRAGLRGPVSGEAAGVSYVYGDAGRLWGGALAEVVTHPLRAMRTVGRAIGDAIAPGEALALKARLLLVGQAIAACRLARVLRHQRVDHVHCHFAHAPTTVGMYAALQLGVPFSFVGHANDLFQRRALLRRKLERAAFVSCISAWHRELYRTIAARGRYAVIRCGIDTDGWQPRPAGHATRDATPTRVITVGRLVEKKGIDHLIRALASVAHDGGDVTLTVIGDGPMADELHRFADGLGVSDRVGFAGEQDNEAVRERLAEADVFALPCRQDKAGDRDGIPVVLMEAMACGLPVVAGDLPTMHELITHDRDGLLVDGTDPDDIARALHRLTGDPALRDRLAEAGRRRVVEEFSLKVNIARLDAELSRAMPTVTPGANGQPCPIATA